MREITFTQFLMPNGRRELVQIRVSDVVAEKADTITALGFKLECEVLSNSMVSLTIADPKEGVDVAIKIVSNGKAVPDAVESMILGYEIPSLAELQDRES